MIDGLCAVWATPDDLTCDDIHSSCDVEEMIEAASELLYLLSGRQFSGGCAITVRPCSPLCGSLCRSVGGCCCAPEVYLPGATEIGEVKEDGVIVAEGEYELWPGGRLIRLTQNGINPGFRSCQSLALADDEVGTFSVTYTQGIAPPVAGKVAAADLACQLALASHPETRSKCVLPSKTISIVRQGVSMQLADPTALLEKGRFGLYSVDAWLASVNPERLQRRSVVISPDSPRLHRAPTPPVGP